MTKNQIRAFLRKELRKGNLEARRVYHDVYDSCHPPEETPNAEWLPAVLGGEFKVGAYRFYPGDLKSGGAWPTLKDDGIFELSTGYTIIQVRVKK